MIAEYAKAAIQPGIGRGALPLEGRRLAADTSKVRVRAGEEDGFRLIELVIAMVMLNVGILAIVAAFSSGNSALARANRISTAGALANKQMEVYRGIKYDNIVFTTTEWNSAIANSTYTNDTVYQQNMLNPTAPKALVGTVTNCPANVPTNACDPSYTTTGADHRSYRVDTYLYYDTPSYGNQLRTVTVVIRNPDDLTRTYSRVTSTFDPSIGG